MYNKELMYDVKKGELVMKNIKDFLKSLSIILLFMSLSSLIGIWFVDLNWDVTNISLIYILGVLMTARLTKGYAAGIISSIIATFLFNYFFTDPLYTLSVYDSKYIVTLVVMTLTAIITSALTSRIQMSTRMATKNAAQTKTLYTLTNRLSDILDYESLAMNVIQIFSKVFECNIGCVCFKQDNGYISKLGKNEDIHNRPIESVCEYRSRFNQLQNSFIESGGFYHYPLYGIHHVLGVLLIEKNCVIDMDDTQNKFLMSMIENVSLALDHIDAIQEQLKLKEMSVKERYRSNLLRAISHDLRTPLSGIMGTSEMIMDSQTKDSPTYELANDIYEEANWLYLLVQNILSLTKVQEGKLIIHKQFEALEEVIGSAIFHVTKNKKKHDISVDVPEEVLMVPMDAKLIEQVFINILDNCLKHSQAVHIHAQENHRKACIMIEDYGEGFQNNQQDVFEMFYSNSKTCVSDGSKGVGLGLTICKAIVEAHGGTIEAKNCTDHTGAQFFIELPMEDKNESEDISSGR